MTTIKAITITVRVAEGMTVQQVYWSLADRTRAARKSKEAEMRQFVERTGKDKEIETESLRRYLDEIEELIEIEKFYQECERLAASDSRGQRG